MLDINDNVAIILLILIVLYLAGRNKFLFIPLFSRLVLFNFLFCEL